MPKILVIDDEPGIRDVLSTILRAQNYEVLVAEDGDAGLRIVDSDSPDLIVTDIVMPGREGIETIMEIKKRKPNAKVIGISGGGFMSSESYLELAKRLGADQVFSKPLEMKLFLAAIAELIAR